jgi:glycosyltransferase A (GT-A) superfamily protein (DUF2064 family)
VADALRDAVARLAGEWAVRTGRAFASDRLPAALVDDAASFAEPGRSELPAALGAALEGHDGPVVLVGADVPRLDDALAAAALSDVRGGAPLSFAPATDARPFLLALALPAPELLAFAGAGEDDRATIAAAAAQLGGEVGLLRSERRLVTPADARALAIDPLVPADLRALAASV